MAFLKTSESGNLYLSVLTIGEMRKGVAALKRRNPAAANEIGRWVDTLESSVEERMLPVARTLPVIDALLAATALRHELILVTRNTQDFESTGVTLLNPWRG